MISLNKINTLLEDKDLKHRVAEEIKQCFRYYDEHSIIIDYLSKNCNHTKYSTENTMNRQSLEFFGPSNKSVLKTEFEILGRIYTKMKDGVPVFKIWVWAWADQRSVAQDSYMSKKIQNYFANDEFGDMTYFYKNLFNKPIIEITDFSHVEVLVALSATIMKNPFLIPLVFDGTENGYALVEYAILLTEENVSSFFEKIKNKEI